MPLLFLNKNKPQRPEDSWVLGFTLIELLVVIAIIAILSVVVILTLNPSELLKQSRDANRVSDLATMNTALGIYAAQSGSSFGSSSVVYVSIPDPTATSTAGDQCQGLGLPALSASSSYFCAASSTARANNGQGWLPVNFSSLSGGSPLGSLPIDPTNATSSNNFYTYTTNGSQYIVTGIPESQKNRSQFVAAPAITYYPGVMAQGSNLTLAPLWNPTGLLGYWSLDQSSGTNATDLSGNGYTGTLVNAPAWVSGKMGNALQFNGSSNYVSTSLGWTSSGTLSFWAYPTSFNNWESPAGWKYAATGNGYILIDEGGAGGTGNWRGVFNPGNTTESDVTMSASILQNQWNYLDLTWSLSGTTYTVTLYLNGLSQGSTTYTGTPLNIGTFAFGTAGQSANNDYAGNVDDVRVYNRPLSAAEVQAIYNSEK
jgi:prepilin-type N-terminal cleavage/methylation domain-containing protein